MPDGLDVPLSRSGTQAVEAAAGLAAQGTGWWNPQLVVASHYLGTGLLARTAVYHAALGAGVACGRRLQPGGTWIDVKDSDTLSARTCDRCSSLAMLADHLADEVRRRGLNRGAP